MKRVNQIGVYWPCPLCFYGIGYGCCICTFGLSLLCPYSCIKDFENMLVDEVVRIGKTPGFHEKGIVVAFEKSCCSSYISFKFDEAKVKGPANII